MRFKAFYKRIVVALKKDPLFSYVTGFVITTHLLLICWAALQSDKLWIPPTQPKPRLVVQTVKLTPRNSPINLPKADSPDIFPTVITTAEIAAADPQLTTPTSEAIEQTPPPPVDLPPPSDKKTVPPTKKVETKKITTKKPETKKVTTKKVETKKAETKKVGTTKVETKKVETKKIVPKDIEPKKLEERKPLSATTSDTAAQTKLAATISDEKKKRLLQQARESIAKIDQKSDKGSLASSTKSGSEQKLPQRIEHLHIDSIVGTNGALVGGELGYRDQLAGRLQALLRLPEYGEVKVELTVTRSGKVDKVAILGSQSALNKSYVESVLPSLTLPSFGSNFKDMAKYTFMITLTNE